MSGSLLTGPVPAFTKAITGFRAVGTLVGDTLQRIAVRELGDAAAWYDIAALNALVPPYLVDDLALTAPGVRLAGQDTVLVPSVGPAPTGVGIAPSVFGVDCLLTGGQLQADGAGDFATVREADNLKQALEMRLGTHPLDLVYHPTYGCRVYTLLGAGGTPVNNQLAAAFVASAIQDDPRVARAEGTVATLTGDVLATTSTAVAVSGKRLPVSVGI